MIGILSGDYLLNSTAALSISGGASYWTNGEGIYEQNQLFLLQRIMVHFSTRELGGRLGLSGKYNVAPSDAVLSELDITQLWAGIHKTFSNWTIETYIRAPLTDEFLRRAFGVNVDFTINP